MKIIVKEKLLFLSILGKVNSDVYYNLNRPLFHKVIIQPISCYLPSLSQFIDILITRIFFQLEKNLE